MKLGFVWSSAVAGLFLSIALNLNAAYADNYYGYGDDGNEDNNAANDGYYKQAAEDDDDKMDNYSGGDDFIKYWTEYAVLPKKCISVKNKDVIVYSIYEKYYNHCADKPVGTYMIDVPTFVSAYVDQLDLNAQDMYGDDYVSPDTTYVNCYPYETNNGAVYYVQIGCTDYSYQSLSVNVYKDNTCTTPDKNANGFDDTSIDVSQLQIPFKQCTSCINFVDSNLDDVDDHYFEQRFKNAPLCETVWEYKQKCGYSCRRKGNATTKGWNSSDKILLSVLGIFSAIMLAVIMKKRTKMSKKDALLEEAAMSAAGIEHSHVVGAFATTLFFIFICGVAGWKGLTWTLLLIVNIILFAYLMKLTIDSGLNVPLGPDGQPIGADESSDDEDDDDDYEDEDDPGAYKPPAEQTSAVQQTEAPVASTPAPTYAAPEPSQETVAPTSEPASLPPVV